MSDTGPLYLQTPIVEAYQSTNVPNYGMCRDGYTKRSGAPTSWMVRLEGEARFRRLMVLCFSNASTCFVRIKGEVHIVRSGEHDLPPQCSICRRRHTRVITHACE